MATDAALPAAPPGAPSEDEYQTFCAALSASARGRAFLAEYARRHRGADTETLLAALARLEKLVCARAHGTQELRHELRGLIGSIRAARSELAEASLPARAVKLTMLLDILERRLRSLAEPEADESPKAEQAAGLAVVPAPEEPELPIPTPAATPRPALALAHERGLPPMPPRPKLPGSAAAIPEVKWYDNAPAEPVAAEIASAATAETLVIPPQFEAAHGGSAGFDAFAELEAATPTEAERQKIEPPPVVEARPRPAETATPRNPLAALLALSEEERIALFT